MSGEPEDTRILGVALFESVRDRLPFQTTCAWEKLLPLLSRHEERETKDGRLWSPVLYREGATRGVDGVIAVYALVLDFDNGETTERYRESWSPFVYHVHSTFSHTWEVPKWRAVFPLATPVPAREWPATWRRLVHALCDNKADPSCKDASRIFYLPACPVGDGARFSATYEGEGWIDPTDMRAFPEPPAPEKPSPTGSATVPLPTEKEALLEKLVGGALSEAFRHGRHKGAIWLGVQCHANGLSEGEAVALALREYCPRLWATNTKGEVAPFAPDFPEAPIAWAYRQAPKEPWAEKRVVTVSATGTTVDRETGEVLSQQPQAGEGEDHAPPPERKWRTFTFDQLAGMDLEEPQFPVEGLLREGINLCMGKTGDGKTWLSTDLAIAIAAGGKALGHRDVIQGDVLYIAFEESRGEMFQRLLQIREETQSFPNLEIASASDSDWPMGSVSETLSAIREWLETHPAARLVVIDPLLGYLAAVSSQNPNMVQGDYNIIKQMRTLARNFPGVAFLVHDHRSKAQVGGANGRDPMDSGVHSSGTIAAADNRLSLVREEGNVFKLHVRGRMVTNQELRLHFDPGLGSWEVKEDRRTLRSSEVGVAILRELAVQPEGMHYAALAERISVTLGTVKGRLFRLVKSGHVVPTGGGEYRLL